jgi:hypothetical protein
MKNKIIDQQTKNVSKGKAVISFGLGIIGSLPAIIIIFGRYIPHITVLNRVLDILDQLLPFGLLNFPFFTLFTSIVGLILGIMSLKSKPSRRLTKSLAIGGIVFSLIGLILGLLLLPVFLYLGSGP